MIFSNNPVEQLLVALTDGVVIGVDHYDQQRPRSLVALSASMKLFWKVLNDPPYIATLNFARRNFRTHTAIVAAYREVLTDEARLRIVLAKYDHF